MFISMVRIIVSCTLFSMVVNGHPYYMVENIDGINGVANCQRKQVVVGPSLMVRISYDN